MEIDSQHLVDLLHECVEVDSVVGYYPEIHEWLRAKVEGMGYTMTVDNHATAYVRVAGEDSSKTVCLGAHLDTIGLLVRGINDDGTLRVRQLGGVNYHNLEGATCTIKCRDGRQVFGQVINTKHSVHVFEDAKTVSRDENTMVISIVDDVKSSADARALGVCEGAMVCIDPEFRAYDNGYVITRHIDDKSCVAVLLDVLDWLAKTGRKPAYDTLFAFPIYEEIGLGAVWVPRDADEYVALDISLVGPDYITDEHSVAVITADAKGPYDWNLTNTLIKLAGEACTEGKWCTEVCFHYSTDANGANHGANDIKAAAFGPACINTHASERFHADAMVETERLCRAFVTCAER